MSALYKGFANGFVFRFHIIYNVLDTLKTADSTQNLIFSIQIYIKFFFSYLLDCDKDSRQLLVYFSIQNENNQTNNKAEIT